MWILSLNSAFCPGWVSGGSGWAAPDPCWAHPATLANLDHKSQIFSYNQVQEQLESMRNLILREILEMETVNQHFPVRCSQNSQKFFPSGKGTIQRQKSGIYRWDQKEEDYYNFIKPRDKIRWCLKLKSDKFQAGSSHLPLSPSAMSEFWWFSLSCCCPCPLHQRKTKEKGIVPLSPQHWGTKPKGFIKFCWALAFQISKISTNPPMIISILINPALVPSLTPWSEATH